MIKNLLNEYQSCLNYFFAEIDIDVIDNVANLILKNNGNVIFSGVGKSAFIAKKVSATFVSVGIKSHFLSPLDAFHGDFGIVNDDDIFIIFSKSGETKELIDICHYAKKRKNFIIALSSNIKAKLKKLVDLFVYLPFKKEICPFNLVPTTSTTIQLIFSDILINLLMEKTQITIKQYSENHPSGLIGKKTNLKVKDLMLSNIPLCKEEEVLLNILPLLSSGACGCIIIVDEKEHILGIFTDGDMRRGIEKEKDAFLKKKMSSIMNKNFKWIEEDLLAIQAIKIMENNNKLVSVLPVLKDKKIIGIIRMHDILKEGLDG